MRRVGFTIGGKRKKAEPYEAAMRGVGLEPVLDPESLTGLEGLVLGGGTDVNPTLYREKRGEHTGDPDDARDALELRLVKRAEQARLPVLAICRGMQLWNIARGGSLLQHIGETHRRPGTAEVHRVRFDGESKLASIYEAEDLIVNSRHHQAVCVIGEGLRVTAWSDDDIVEGLEDPNLPFAVGVQWHPEDLADRRLFQAFARAVAENRK
jgi:putative glutamine amidotransferase